MSPPPEPTVIDKSEGFKNTWTTLAPENAASDPEFQKMVKKMEGTVHGVGGGWLKKMGAFDQGDLLYLQEMNAQDAQAEANRNDAELAAFAQFRAAADKVHADDTSARKVAAVAAPLPKVHVKKAPLVVGIGKMKLKTKVKASPSGTPKTPQEGSGAGAAGEGAFGSPAAESPHGEAGAKQLSGSKRPHSETEDEPPTDEAKKDDDDDDGGNTLFGMLGGYGDDDDDDSD